MDANRSKYNKLENELHLVNKNFVTLNDNEKKKYNPVLQYVIDDIIEKMKSVSTLFKNLYESVYYGGSFYDNLKVGKPEEYDIDLKMTLPKLLETKLVISNEPGFVKVTLPGWDNLEKNAAEFQKYSELKKMKDDKNYLLQDKILSWMEQIVNRALNKYEKVNEKIFLVPYKNYKMEVKLKKGGPAMTLTISSKELDISMDVDLVASFKFTEENWPDKPFEPLPKECMKKEFLVVPKKPKGQINDIAERLWRLSFQEQERDIMNGKGRFKPALRLMKKLRDTQGQCKISSYFLKTIFLNEVTELARKKDTEFWELPLGFVFMHMLNQYQKCLENGNVPYYWNKKNNLLKAIDPNTISNYKFKVKKIIDTIDRKLDTQPDIIMEYILTVEERTNLNVSNPPCPRANTDQKSPSTSTVPELFTTPSTKQKPEKTVQGNELNLLDTNILNKILNMYEVFEKNINVIKEQTNIILDKIDNIEKSVNDIKCENIMMKSELESIKSEKILQNEKNAMKNEPVNLKMDNKQPTGLYRTEAWRRYAMESCEYHESCAMCGIAEPQCQDEPDSVVNGYEPDTVINRDETDSGVNRDEPDSVVNGYEPDSVVNRDEPDSGVNVDQPDSAVNENASKMSLLLNKMILLEQSINDIKKENNTLKAGLRQYVLPN